jgi:hypothetical protein
MAKDTVYDNSYDNEGNPTSGTVKGIGLTVDWQDGVMSPDRSNQSGAIIQDLVEAVVQRLRFYNSASNGKFACRENSLAITHMEEALHWMWSRETNRRERGVLGTYSP